MLEGGEAEIDLHTYYHDIVYEIYQCAPQMLLAVIPNFTQELVVCHIFRHMYVQILFLRIFYAVIFVNAFMQGNLSIETMTCYELKICFFFLPQNDQVNVRLKAVKLLGRLFALPGHHVAKEYRLLYLEFLKRFTDKAVEVRLAMINCAKECLKANPSMSELNEILGGNSDQIERMEY